MDSAPPPDESARPGSPGIRGRIRAPKPNGSGARRPGRRVRATLVAGGAGFLGSHLCDRLIAEGRRVYCVDSLQTGRLGNLDHLAGDPRLVFMEHDVRRPLPVFPDVDEVCNLACPASPPHYQKSPIDTVTTSIVGTLNLLEMARDRGARFLLTSTSEIYGDPEVHPQPESYRGNVSATGPRACYDEGKRVAETLCFDFIRQYRTDVRVARVFNTYGPRMRLDDGRIITNFIGQALRGEQLTVYGSGRQTRSFCYVADLVEGLVRLLRAPGAVAGPVNLGNPEEHTILEVADLIGTLTGRRIVLAHRPLPEDDPQRRRPDIALARRLLGWSPRIPLREGLGATIDWFEPQIATSLPLADAEAFPSPPCGNGRGPRPGRGLGG